MNIGMLIIMLVGGLAGILSTLYLLVSLPVVVIQKVYRKVRFRHTNHEVKAVVARYRFSVHFRNWEKYRTVTISFI